MDLINFRLQCIKHYENDYMTMNRNAYTKKMQQCNICEMHSISAPVIFAIFTTCFVG